MKKFFNLAKDNILFLLTIFLLVFIPLYPKLPLLDIKNTWVYIRVEDFLVLFVLGIWALLLVTKKITLKTPLTIPIFAFWIIGGVATLHGIIFIFPYIANVFPNVAYLSFIRHIEYMSLFFVAYSGMKNKKFLSVIIAVIALTLLTVILYGFGQKYLGFNAYLTMNEEFAKGIPIQLSALSRVPSTFAGHYDLAAYLVLVVPIIFSIFFGLKSWILKTGTLALVFLSFVLMFMTVSRVSFLVLFISLFFVILFQKKKLALFVIPAVFLFFFILVFFQTSLFSRFGNTVASVDVLVSGTTGQAVGNIEYVPARYFDNKKIKPQKIEEGRQVVSSEYEEDLTATGSAALPIDFLSPDTLVPLVKASNISTGETLPQGTGYINLSLSPVVKRVGDFYYELSPDVVKRKGDSFEVVNFQGNFLIKRASAYDLSFTTRLQGEWPKAISSFERNILFGSGYGSVSLAVDNNYLRMLGETGLLGTLSFIAIFVILGIYIKKVLVSVDSKLVRSFVLGFSAGVIGLFLNATLIDVFEASKIAFTLWILAGVTAGILFLYNSSRINILNELKKVSLSIYAVFLYLLAIAIALYVPMLTNFFAGDDFTWFKWVSECKTCSPLENIFKFFTYSDGFFFRPGTKTYFYGMYSIFWMNQTIYHFVSLMLHFLVSLLFFVFANKIFKDRLLAFFCAGIFLVISGITENIFWISATGYLITTVFALASLLSFIKWEEKRNIFFFLLALVFVIFGLLFHEVDVVVPLLLISYSVIFSKVRLKNVFKNGYYLFLFVPDVLYLILRFFAGSHWFSGDYSYNIVKLPFNFIGNILGYMLLIITGSESLPLYESLRAFSRENLFISIFLSLVLICILIWVYLKIIKKIDAKDKGVIIFSVLFFAISLLPFLGLGNITSRYSYLASLGLIILLVFFANKIYAYLLGNGRGIAILSMSVLSLVFVLLHLIELQSQHNDWRGSGIKVRNFFTSIDSEYEDYWGKEKVDLRFVNVPIKNGSAWVFPVGLSDAIWLTFQNDNMRVFQDKNIEYATEQANNSFYNAVFIFQEDGKVKEINTRRKLQTP